MNDTDRHNFGIALLEMVASLHKAVGEAGGDPLVAFNVGELQTMTVFELMCILAANNVRFTHIPRE